MQSLVLSTTGNVSTVTFASLGNVTYTHPITVELLVSNGGDFETDDIQVANAELTASVAANEITLTDGQGNNISNPISELAESVNLTTDQPIDGIKTFIKNLIIRTVNAAAGGLVLDTDASSSFWKIFAGSTANFDNWLRFSNSGSGNPNEAVLTNQGSFRTLNGSAGNPGHGFINGSNYGVSLQGSNDVLALSAAGVNRLTFNGTNGQIRYPTLGAGSLITSASGIVTVRSFQDRQASQSQTEQTINFGAGTTAYQTLNNSSNTTGNTVAQDYICTANFSSRVTNNNNRTLQFAIFVDSVETVTFEVTRYDQANDDKSITIRWELFSLSPSTVVDWRIRNINASANWQLNRRNFTLEQFSFN